MPVTVAVLETEKVTVTIWPVLAGLGVGLFTVTVGARTGACTVNDKLVEWLALPPATLIVKVTVPRVAVAVAEKDTVTVQVGLQRLFAKVAVTPVGKPVAEKVTGVVVPLASVAIIEEDELVEP
jgi:hypothetical protein